MTYSTLARLLSSSTPGTSYEVATEGTHLSCNCPGWTRQVHYRDCPAVTAGRTCTCRAARPPGRVPQDARTCKHVREIEPYVRRLGGIPQAIAACRGGVDIRYASASAELRARMEPPPVRTATETQRLQVGRRQAARPCCRTLGCTRPAEPGRRHCARHTVSAPADPPADARDLHQRLRESLQTGRSAAPTRAIRIREDDDE